MQGFNDELTAPDELAQLLQGTWQVGPRPNSWAPSSVFQRAPKRRNPSYSPDAISIVATERSLRLATEELAQSSSFAGALILPSHLAELTVSQDLPPRLPVLAVPDSIDPLQTLAAAGRARLRKALVLVTGTAGKTSTRRMTSSALEAFGSVAQNRQNWNFTPHIFEDLASIRKSTDYAVLELGLGEPGVALDRASKTASPHVAIITNVGMAHHDVVQELPLQREDLLERVLEAKLATFSALGSSGLGILASSAVLGPWVRERLKETRWVTYGEGRTDTYRLLNHVQARDHANTTFSTPSRELQFRLLVPGRHMALNALAAVAVAEQLDLDVSLVIDRLKAFQSRGHRLRPSTVKFSRGTFLVIDDHFNANTSSIDAGFATLRSLADAWGGRAVAVLGDLVDHSIWGSPEDFYGELGRRAVAFNIDVVATFGPGIRAIHETLPPSMNTSHHSTRKELRQWLLANVQDGDVLLLKASKEMHFDRLSSLLKSEATTSPH